MIGLFLAVAAGPAWGQTEGHRLDLSGPSAATVGQAIVIQATGAYPSTDFFSSWLDIHAIPMSVVSTCPPGYLNSSQLAGSTYGQGGDTVAIAQRATGDASGNYSMPFAYTPRVAGRFIVCGYANDGATWTHAMDSLVLDVGSTAPPPGGDTPPVPGGGSTERVRVTLSQSYDLSRRSTRFRSLRVKRVPSGSTVVATCKFRGRKCSGRARRTFTRRNASGTVSLSAFTRVALKPGTVIRITVRKPGAVAAVKVVTIRRSKAPRTKTR